jgi:hypothetical protein
VRPIFHHGEQPHWLQLGDGVGFVELGDASPAAPEILVFAPQERCDEVILRPEMPIEARLGDPRFLDHQVNAHGAPPRR